VSRWPAHAAGAAAAARHTSPVRVVPLSRWPFAAAGDSAAPPPLAAAAAARLTIDAVVVERAGARSSLTAKFHYTDTGPTRTRTFLRRNSVGSVRVRFAAKKSVSGPCPCPCSGI